MARRPLRVVGRFVYVVQRGCAHKVQHVFCSRHCHVQQPHLFLVGFYFVAHGNRLGRKSGSAGHCVEIVVVHRYADIEVIPQLTVIVLKFALQVGYYQNGEFQALGCVHRHHTHRIGRADAVGQCVFFRFVNVGKKSVHALSVACVLNRIDKVVHFAQPQYAVR